MIGWLDLLLDSLVWISALVMLVIGIRNNWYISKYSVLSFFRRKQSTFADIPNQTIQLFSLAWRRIMCYTKREL
jgi:hypothetical protein